MKDDFPIDRRDLTQQSYELLKEEILNRRFQPNEKLSIDRIAKLLGVSRTPVKDALNRLAADGLITITPRVGSFVTPVTVEDVNEIFSIRKLIEIYAAEEGIGCIDSDKIKQMEKIVAEMAGCIEGNRYHPNRIVRFLELDHSLHCFLVKCAGNEHLTSIYENLHVHSYIARVYYSRELANAHKGQTEHERIVQACAGRDLDVLKAVLEEHISDVQRLVVEYLEFLGGVL